MAGAPCLPVTEISEVAVFGRLGRAGSAQAKGRQGGNSRTAGSLADRVSDCGTFARRSLAPGVRPGSERLFRGQSLATLLAGALLFLHLPESQSRANRDDIENRMGGIGWQAQAVELFPDANAYVGRVTVRALRRELILPQLRTLGFLQRDAGTVRLDKLSRARARSRFIRKQPGHRTQGISPWAQLTLTRRSTTIASLRLPLGH